MFSKKTLAATAAAMIAVGSFGLAPTGASAASMKPAHVMLTCKAGSVAHLVRVKIHGKWHKVWRCHRVKHHTAMPKAKTY